MSISDWRSYGEGLSPEYEFPSGVPDFQNSVGAATAKIGRIKLTCIKENTQSMQNSLLATNPTYEIHQEYGQRKFRKIQDDVPDIEGTFYSVYTYIIK